VTRSCARTGGVGRKMKARRLLFGAACVVILLVGCVTQSVRNDPMGDLLQRVGANGRVLLYGSVSGDVNAFAIETSDGRRYEVSQVVKDPGLRLFFFLDVPRDFTITRVSTESGTDPYVLNTHLPVKWRGSVAESWINSTAMYLGRIDLRFKPKGAGVVEGMIDGSRENEDRGLLQQALSAALSVPRSSLPLAGQPPPPAKN
jgi:hypothetical protein